MNAVLYTVLITVILLVPLYLYTVYTKQIHEIQNELMLKQHYARVVSAMEEFDENREAFFEYPRFRRIQSGLYDLHFKPIFTTIETPMEHFTAGYHIDESHYAYLIVPLPRERYFGADYLIVGNHLSYAPVYQRVMTILFAITVLVFFLSLFFLKRFAQPFRRVNRKLDNFIKDTVHEINTPLSIININVDLYNRKHPQNKYLQRIKAASKTLSTIYDDMEYLIKNKHLVFEYTDIDLSEFVRERVLYFDEVAAMKNIMIVSDVREGIRLHFNATQLQRIIDNNLTNAIKYTKYGETIRIDIAEEGEAYVLSIASRSSVIEDIDKIFEAYYRERKKSDGFGLGLNLVKSICDEEGVEIMIESTEEQTRFAYRFKAVGV